MITPLGLARGVRLDADAVFVTWSDTASEIETRLIGTEEASMFVTAQARPSNYRGGMRQFDPRGMARVRFIGWIIAGVFHYSGAVPRAMQLYLCFMRRPNAVKTEFIFALNQMESRDINALVISTLDVGGAHFADVHQLRDLWHKFDLIEIQNQQAMATETSAYLLGHIDDKKNVPFLAQQLHGMLPYDPHGGLMVLNFANMSPYNGGAPWRNLALVRAAATPSGKMTFIHHGVFQFLLQLPANSTGFNPGQLLYARNAFHDNGKPAWRLPDLGYAATEKTLSSTIMVVSGDGFDPVANSFVVSNGTEYVLIGRIFTRVAQDAGIVLGVDVVTGVPGAAQ